jgi:exopolysaccharide biosynthesis polyprenyl glycosylphosphotransferase
LGRSQPIESNESTSPSMLRRQREVRAHIHRIVDACLFGLGFWLAHWIRSIWPLEIFGGTAEIQPFSKYNQFLFAILPLAPLLLGWQGFYVRPLLVSRRRILMQLLMASALMVIALIVLLFLVKVQLARAVIILFGVASFILVFLKEQLVWLWVRSRLGQSDTKKRLIILGGPSDKERLERELRLDQASDFVVSAELDLNVTPVERLVEELHDHSANAVVLNPKHAVFGQIEKAIEICELEGVEVWMLANIFKTQVFHTTLDEINAHPVLVFRSTPEESWQIMAKRVIDFCGALFLLAVLSLPLLLVAWLVKLTSPGPALFRQQRSGLNGRPFVMLKFRSMVSDAEQRQHELQAMNEMTGPVFKVSQDPRITTLGRWLRRFSVDELPQLINVLKGEMSLVGPRPLPVDEVRRFNDLSHRRRLSVKPGITCLWQVSGRNNVTDFGDWVRLDLEYIDNWSLWLDMKILLRTIPAVFLGAGAK